MRQRLAARGKSWEEFVELLANFRVDEQERKQKNMKPILPPPHAVPKGDRKKRKERPQEVSPARHDLQPPGYYRNRRGRPA